jgi:GntR family transcriptional regulator, rspAB operon transcriptional repressor
MGLSKSKKLIAYEKLKAKIIDNIMKPGEIINETELAAALNTSKTPVREALQRLETEGFIENIHGKGYFVTRISIQDLKELFDIRNLLECEIIKRVALVITPEKINAVRNAFKSSGSKIGPSMKGYLIAGDKIHTLIFETYGNKRLMDLYKKFHEHIIRNRRYLFKDVDEVRSSQSYIEHMNILDALAAKDPLCAEKAIREHLHNSMEYQWKKLINSS